MNFPESFSFDWVMESNENRKVEGIDFYSENGYDIVLLRANINIGRDEYGVNEWKVRYEVGNPLLGGVKNYASYNTAEKYFYELIGRVHRDAEIRKGVA